MNGGKKEEIKEWIPESLNHLDDWKNKVFHLCQHLDPMELVSEC